MPAFFNLFNSDKVNWRPRSCSLKTRMILTVHDELLFEAPRGEADEAAAVVRERMEGAAQLAVPLTVDVGMAENWRDAKS